MDKKKKLFTTIFLQRLPFSFKNVFQTAELKS